MIHLHYRDQRRISVRHYIAVLSYVRSKSDDEIDRLYSDVRGLLPHLPADRNAADFSWLRRFLLASPIQIDDWVNNKKGSLEFDFFKKLYVNRFAKSPNDYVDSQRTYNAYSLLESIDFHVCPYCDENYMDIVEIEGKMRRTFDIDHFHPKNMDDFPALAMCFYNLIPSCKVCNSIKNASYIAANPYREDIEEWSHFIPANPDVFFGRILESLTDDEIKIRLITQNGMTANNNIFGIEQRYNRRTDMLKRFFIVGRALKPENIEEKLRLGFTLEHLEIFMGKPYPQSRGHEVHQKIRHDLTGY